MRSPGIDSAKRPSDGRKVSRPAPRDEPLAIRREGQAVDDIGVTGEPSDQLASREFVEANVANFIITNAKSGRHEPTHRDVADGVEIKTSSAFEKLIATKPPGTQLRLLVMSGGSERRISVTLTERKIGTIVAPCSCSTLAGTWRSSRAFPSRRMECSWSRLGMTRSSASGTGGRARSSEPSAGRSRR
jgi:hypothetical protein